MEAEDDLLRPPPPCPYQPGGARLVVSTAAVAATGSLLQRAGRRESGLFWYGSKDADGNGHVMYVVAPRQHMGWANYYVPPDAMTQIVTGLPDGWKPLAQVHSHPGHHVEHSNYDDRMVSSRRALSLVFPFYGRTSGTFPSGIGVHECQNGYWYLLDFATARNRVVLCDGEVRVDDFR